MSTQFDHVIEYWTKNFTSGDGTTQPRRWKNLVDIQDQCSGDEAVLYLHYTKLNPVPPDPSDFEFKRWLHRADVHLQVRVGMPLAMYSENGLDLARDWFDDGYSPVEFITFVMEVETDIAEDLAAGGVNESSEAQHD